MSGVISCLKQSPTLVSQIVVEEFEGTGTNVLGASVGDAIILVINTFESVLIVSSGRIKSEGRNLIAGGRPWFVGS